MVTTDLMSRARTGDGDAFRELTEPHRRELQVHCYRMLGSFQDAEDALQDTLMAAWQGLAGFEGRASIRTWLYRIATNRCLNALRSAGRRPAKAWSIPEVDPPEPPGPEAHYEQTEAVSLAFVTALQVLPARQRAVLVLRDVLGYHAGEVADMLDATVASVDSALKRARATLRRRVPPGGVSDPPPAPGSPAERALVARLARAYRSGNVPALVALLTEDVVLTMPPLPLEYAGRDAVAGFFAALLGHRRFDLVPTRANGQPASGTYLRDPAGGVRRGTGLDVLTLDGDRIRAITHFDSSVLPSFGLPRSLPG